MSKKTENREDCPVCRFGLRNCRAYGNGSCMALESLDPKWTRCPFYKSEEQYEAEDKKVLARLREKRMTGRLERYRKEKVNDVDKQKKQ